VIDGKAVTGDELLRHLDKARRIHDAEAIMAFVTKMEVSQEIGQERQYYP
jgi:hypothetical protein